jgi:hypothetical protein
MNLQAIHYAMLLCGALAAGLPNLEAAFPASATPWLKGLAAIFVLLTAVLGAVSPAAGGPKTIGKVDVITDGKVDIVTATASKLSGALFMILALGALMLPACKSTTLPSFLNLVSVVEADLVAGDGEAQISSDVCKALGGSALTDAVCANVGTIIYDIVVYLVDGGNLPPAAAKWGHDFLASHSKVSR